MKVARKSYLKVGTVSVTMEPYTRVGRTKLGRGNLKITSFLNGWHREQVGLAKLLSIQEVPGGLSYTFQVKIDRRFWDETRNTRLTISTMPVPRSRPYLFCHPDSGPGNLAATLLESKLRDFIS